MSIHRYAARTDANKAAIVAALLAAGAKVYDLRMPVDLLVHRAGRMMLIEIKDGSKPPSARKHTPAQARFLADGWPVVTVKTVDEALAALAGVTSPLSPLPAAAEALRPAP